jgi:hypothetical protein
VQATTYTRIVARILLKVRVEWAKKIWGEGYDPTP